METVGWIKRDWATNRITSSSKIHYTKDGGKTTLCGINTEDVSYDEIDDGSFNSDYCKKCEKKA